ncbi:hypothetical protein T11_10599 [Trichinella zimbabwensis]|uniref:Uncharacterized protein n=1 Tax=Trichinella zimbabwensis TaxID=268475 RepID=A0A0V1HYE3_9BILA|nr:hypothetical protein T11_10599 [Trichinella zimbabwensis]
MLRDKISSLKPEEHHSIAWLNSLEFFESGAQHCTVLSEIYTKRSTLNCFLCQPILLTISACFFVNELNFDFFGSHLKKKEKILQFVCTDACTKWWLVTLHIQFYDGATFWQIIEVMVVCYRPLLLFALEIDFKSI